MAFHDTVDRIADSDSILHVLEAAPVGMIKVDLNGTIVLTNRELERMFRYPRERLLGAHLDLLIPERYRQAHSKHLRNFQNSPQKRQMAVGRELFGRRSDGSEFPVDVALNPVNTDRGSFVVASVIDVTEQRRASRQLAELAATLQEKNQELERFVITVSHDLKSPIVTVLGYIEHLTRDVEECKYGDLSNYAARVKRAAERMKLKIDDLLSFSRLGRDTTQPGMTSIAGVLRALLDAKRDQLSTLKARVELDLTVERVWCDPIHLEQVLENLLTNAMRHGIGPRDPLFVFRSRPCEDYAEIIVEDNGPGIEPKYAERVFGLFQRLSSDSDSTGVGLAIVRRVATLYGGKAWVDGSPGGGARFHITLPARPDARCVSDRDVVAGPATGTPATAGAGCPFRSHKAQSHV